MVERSEAHHVSAMGFASAQPILRAENRVEFGLSTPHVSDSSHAALRPDETNFLVSGEFAALGLS
jgi:hypothetical protein